MSTVRDIIQAACRKIGALAAGESLDAAEAQNHLGTLNAMLAAWNTDQIFIYSTNRQVFPLTIGTQTYTLGNGGNFNVPRPFKIDMAGVLLPQPEPAQPLEVPLNILTDEQWRLMAIKNLTGGFPTDIYILGDVPLNHLTVWPNPQQPCSLVLYTWNRITAFTGLSDEVVLPDGYERAIVYNLAIDIAPEYEREPSATVQRLAIQSLELLKNANWEPIYSQCEEALMGRPGNSIAIRTQGLMVDP